jgi:hypothetical protein
MYDMESSGRGLFVDLFQNLPGDIDENHEIFIQDNRALVRDLNLGPGKYERQLNTLSCDVQYIICFNPR